jgi:hypothetical protein
MAHTLDYARPNRRRPHPNLARQVLYCALVPLAVGFSIVFACGVTGWSVLPIFGLIWIGIGTLVVLIGAIFLLFSLVNYLLDQQPVGRTLVKYALLGALLLSNFPAAWLCVRLAPQLHHF